MNDIRFSPLRLNSYSKTGNGQMKLSLKKEILDEFGNTNPQDFPSFTIVHICSTNVCLTDVHPCCLTWFPAPPKD